MLTSNPYAGERQGGTVGAALPGVSLRVVDDQNQSVPVGRSAGFKSRVPMCLPVTGLCLKKQ